MRVFAFQLKRCHRLVKSVGGGVWACAADERAGRLGTLSVSVTACVVGTPVPGPVLVATYPEAAEFGRFVPLARDFDLRREMEKTDGERLDSCPRPE